VYRKVEKSKNNNIAPLVLKRTGYLCDVEDNSSIKIDRPTASNASVIEILQNDSWKEFYFVGLYSLQKDKTKVQMDKLLIRRKKDNLLFQEIGLTDLESKVGNTATIIHKNVEVCMNDEILLSSDVGRLGGYYILTYDTKMKQFTLDRNVVLEGGDPGDPE
jgi:hypothetical protein